MVKWAKQWDRACMVASVLWSPSHRLRIIETTSLIGRPMQHGTISRRMNWTEKSLCMKPGGKIGPHRPPGGGYITALYNSEFVWSCNKALKGVFPSH